jgi:hypothetical protein
MGRTARVSIESVKKLVASLAKQSQGPLSLQAFYFQYEDMGCIEVGEIANSSEDAPIPSARIGASLSEKYFAMPTPAARFESAQAHGFGDRLRRSKFC